MPPAGACHAYWIRVTQEDGAQAWTSPVYLAQVPMPALDGPLPAPDAPRRLLSPAYWSGAEGRSHEVSRRQPVPRESLRKIDAPSRPARYAPGRR